MMILMLLLLASGTTSAAQQLRSNHHHNQQQQQQQQQKQQQHDSDTILDLEFLEDIVQRDDIFYLANDGLGGRFTYNSTGSQLAQEYLIDELISLGAVGLDPSKSGRDAFRQTFKSGTNILGILKGSELPDEYVLLSAHYDGIGPIGFLCENKVPFLNEICNAATDNAASVALALGIGRKLAALPQWGFPRRSIVFGFWDQEEFGLEGSRYFAQDNPLIPLQNIVTVLNFDITGANILPSLRSNTFAIGSESGGRTLQSMLLAATLGEPLQVRTLSNLFGAERGDYINFRNEGVPFVFFTDSTGPCYHTNGDKVQIVDFDKLEIQARIGLKLAYDLSNTVSPPCFANCSIVPVTLSDLWKTTGLLNQAVKDVDLFQEEDQTELLSYQFFLNSLALNPFYLMYILAFDMEKLEESLDGIVELFTRPECSGFRKED